MRFLAPVYTSIVIAACGGTTTTPQPAPGGTASQALYTAPCTSSVCGSQPSGMEKCVPNKDSCEWHDVDPDGTVSYRPCASSECGKEPGAEVCPPGTTFKGNQCGSENEAACRWTTTCAPPRSTKPCATDACGPMPEIGVICKDGSTGALACMDQNGKCGWERTCD
jgi:hypothetical protein